MRALFMGDMHYSVTPPAQRKENYPELILAKFSFIQKVAKKLKVDAVVSAGDWFHRKLYHSHSFIELNTILSSFDQNIYSILGNHDLTGYQRQSIEHKPIGALVNSGVVKLLDDFFLELPDNNVVTGVSYQKDYNRLETFKVKFPSKYKSWTKILITHASLHKRKPVYDDYVLIKDLKGIEADIIVNGHIHHSVKPEFVEEKVSSGKKMFGAQIFQLGSIARESIELKDYNPRILLLITGKEGLEHRWLDVPVEDDVWDEDVDSLLDSDEDAIKKLVQEIIDQDEDIADDDLVKMFEKASKKLKHKNGNKVVDTVCQLIDFNK